MILDSIGNAALYHNLSPDLSEALSYLQTLECWHLENQTISPRLTALFQNYTTRLPQDCIWEYHRQYIDIQYVFEGEEIIRWAETRNVPGWTPYSLEKDCATSPKHCLSLPVTLTAGQFMILFPEDAHMPKCAVGEPSSVKKIVVKIPVYLPSEISE